MKFARIAVLLIAVIAGALAAMLAGGNRQAPVTQIVQEAPKSEVLVAREAINMGQVVNEGTLVWRAWPEDGASGFITRAAQPDAINDLKGAIARQPIAQGEPINTQKIVKTDGSGFLAAILPAGMRAVATTISPETGAGGFILPNDHVDVILTHRQDRQQNDSADRFISETILSNVRVLAIDQAVKEQEGQQSAVGRTATLELSPRQAEVLAQARDLGTLSLALRSLADANPNGPEGDGAERADKDSTSTVSVIRYGIERK